MSQLLETLAVTTMDEECETIVNGREALRLHSFACSVQPASARSFMRDLGSRLSCIRR